MRIGTKATRTITVTEALTAEAVGSGTLPVFATPAMAALMEGTAMDAVREDLEPGQGTVGTSLTLTHAAPTPIGMEVSCEAELIAVDRRKLTFKVTCRDACGMIGEGTHERFVIDEASFLAKAESKAVKEVAHE